MAAGWERVGLIFGAQGGAGLENRACREQVRKQAGAGGGSCRNGGIWDLSHSYGSLSLGEREKLRQGKGNVVRGGQMLSALLGGKCWW